MVSILLLLALNFASLAQAQDEYVCDFQGVHEVETAVYPGQLNSPRFKFKYQIVGDLNPDELVIINLPGGPGGSSMNQFDNEAVIQRFVSNSGFPKTVPWIMIDPRTVGCNRGDENKFPDDSLNSPNLAHDVLSVIEDLKLKKYVIYGHSYGSQAATYVAALASERAVPAPHAVFLSGILGLGREDGSFSIPEQKIVEWNKIKKQLSPKILSILNTDKPMGLENYAWQTFISSGLYDGYYMVKGEMKNPLIEKLKLLDSDDPTVYAPLLQAVDPKDPVPRPGRRDYSSRLFNKVDCHEYSPRDGSVDFVNGDLVFDAENDPCKDEPFDRPYDSALLQMNTHIYYLSGTADVAAPYIGARHHFEHQNSSRRNFITVPGGGHTNLGWVYSDCMNKIWEKIFAQEDLTDALSSCKAQFQIEILPAD